MSLRANFHDAVERSDSLSRSAPLDWDWVCKENAEVPHCEVFNAKGFSVARIDDVSSLTQKFCQSLCDAHNNTET